VEGEITKVEPFSDPNLNAEQADPKELSTDQAADPELLSREPPGELVYRSYEFSGPIPSPEIFAGYDRALPNGADRVMKMAEREQEHRHRMEDTIVRKESFEKRVGLVFAFVLAAFALGVSAYLLIWTNKSVPGLTTFIISFVGLALAFLGAKKQKRSDENEDFED
jgi:uncharacterized membrane protein